MKTINVCPNKSGAHSKSSFIIINTAAEVRPGGDLFYFIRAKTKIEPVENHATFHVLAQNHAGRTGLKLPLLISNDVSF